MEKEIGGFRIDFEVDSGKSFLVLSENGLSRHDIIGFQVEMIAKNKIPGVARLNIRERDLEKRFYYDISGLISLTNFFMRQKVTKADFIRILQNITGALTGCKNFLLNDKCFVISENLIFLDPASLEVFLIYIPCRSDADIVELFKTFVVKLIVNTANIETDDNFVQKILDLIKEEHLCISEFNTAIRRVNGTPPPIKSEQGYQGDGGQVMNSAVNPDPPKVRETLMSANPNRAANFAPVIFVLLIITAAVAMKINNILEDVNIMAYDYGKLQVFGGVSAVIVAAGIIATVSLRKKTGDTGQSKLITSEININQSETAAKAQEAGKNEANPANLEETVVLSSQLQPILVGIGEEECIVISKSDFVIGRNLDTCDYAIHNKSIGRAHARIQNNDGRFFLFDLDSKNGTFLNGDRLVSNKQYELKPTDRVSFANLQFCFKME